MSAYSEARDLLAAMHADHEREVTTADGTRPLFCGHLDYAVEQLLNLETDAVREALARVREEIETRLEERARQPLDAYNMGTMYGYHGVLELIDSELARHRQGAA